MTKLKQIRNDAGISQGQLATASGINVRMIQHYEQGVKDINKTSVITVYKLAKALHVNIEELIEIN